MKSKALPCAAAMLAVSLGALGSELRPARDGRVMEAVIARNAPTRIRVVGERITDIVGNIASSSQCGGKPADAAGGALPAVPAAVGTNARGDLVLTCDPAQGEVYVTPVARLAKPVTLFISTARATHALQLRVEDVPAGAIVIHDAAPVDRRVGAAPLPDRGAAHVRRLKAMLLALVRDEQPPGTERDDTVVPTVLWRETAYRRVRQVSGAGLVGETYRLTNISAAPMVLDEQEFDQQGGQVLAVAIERTGLLPGEETAVHLIRKGE